MFINNNVSFSMVLFCKCVREFGKVWVFARAEFGMGGTGICPSPFNSTLLEKHTSSQKIYMCGDYNVDLLKLNSNNSMKFTLTICCQLVIF